MNRAKYIIAVVCIVFIWLLCKAYINIEVSKETHKTIDTYEEKIAQLKISLQADKIQIEKNLKQQLLDSKTELDKCKLEQETETKKKQYKELSKKNPKEFKKQVDKTLGVKEKHK